MSQGEMPGAGLPRRLQRNVKTYKSYRLRGQLLRRDGTPCQAPRREAVDSAPSPKFSELPSGCVPHPPHGELRGWKATLWRQSHPSPQMAL